MRTLSTLVLVFLYYTIHLQAQVALFSENFESCALPNTWQVNTTGNPNPTWYVANECTNNDAVGQSMNGSCFLIIDDDATGDNTPAYVIDFVSPSFDCSQHPNIQLEMDVHYRDWADGAETFSVLLATPTDTIAVRAFSQGQSTGNTFSEILTLKFDLSLLSQSPNTRLIIRYDDAGAFNWWAGVDNIKITGSGVGTNIIAESFNDCGVQPAGWSTSILSGDQNWQFGTAINGGQSMNGTCFAFFDDDILGQNAPYSTARLATPWFDGSAFSEFELTFDIIHRYYSEVATILVEHSNGDEFVVAEWKEDVGGPNWNDFVQKSLDLSPYRSIQMRVVFQYSDGNDWGWWTGIDNVKVIGNGAANDLCANALLLETNAACIEGNTQNAIFDGPLPTCGSKPRGGLWYKWQADLSGDVVFSSKSDFNDVISIFTGGCTSPTLLQCTDYDEHGFIGEKARFTAQSGTTYLIRVHGQSANFGISKGNLCAGIAAAPAAPPVPTNDQCLNAPVLTLGAACANGQNIQATTSPTLPSLNELARADVWYKFIAPALAPNEKIVFQSKADFSDVITAYKGTCGSLVEIASNHEGASLDLFNLSTNETYWIQVSGSFATIEGHLCPEIQKTTINAPPNDNCIGAINLNIGTTCTASNNTDAGFSGLVPPCVPNAARDVWFKFTAPATGSVQINTGADFEHIATVWKGNCNNLEPIKCLKNPLRCNGYTTVGELIPGQQYWLQIASLNGPGGVQSGSLCVHLLSGNTVPPFTPIDASATAICLGLDITSMVVQVNGGQAPYTFDGDANGNQLPGGTDFLTIVRDANGCEVAITGTTPACLTGCLINSAIQETTPICGNNTGALSVNVSAGIAPYTYAWSNGHTTQNITGLAAGQYEVTVTDAGACSTTATYALVGYPTLNAQVIGSEPIINGLGAIFVEVTGGSGAGYQYVWTFNNAIVSNAQNLSGVSQEGTYTLLVTDGAGCNTLLTYYLQSVSTNDLAGLKKVSLTPNPSSGISSLFFHLAAATNVQVSLSDSRGRLLKTWKLGTVIEQQVQIDLETAPSGVYWIRVMTDHGVKALRLVKI